MARAYHKNKKDRDALEAKGANKRKHKDRNRKPHNAREEMVESRDKIDLVKETERTDEILNDRYTAGPDGLQPYPSGSTEAEQDPD